jgi:hypothetical protein
MSPEMSQMSQAHPRIFFSSKATCAIHGGMLVSNLILIGINAWYLSPSLKVDVDSKFVPSSSVWLRISWPIVQFLTQMALEQ